MAVSKRSVLSGTAVATAALVALALAPVLAGSASGATAAAGGCAATAHIDSQWGGGQIVTVTVVNTAPAAATSWTVTWTPASGQRVVSAWNATVSAAGTTATAVNASYNGALAPGASITFGMQLAGTGPAPVLDCANDAAQGSADVTATVADNGTTLTLYVGQTLAVSLPANYRPPVASGPALSAQSSTGGFPSGQPVLARYRASAPGTADVSSQTDDPCLHTTPPCARPVALWLVHVTVLPSAGRTVTVTQADNAGTVTLRTGDTLVVSLPAMYGPPTVAPAGVLALAGSTGGYPTGQALLARYTAAAVGRADVSTVSDAACLHQPIPCPSPQVPWRLHVTVTA
ncbi:cellulose binding domain-containing protein [Dactylosporangium sp. McL0621]|uniref:cellulose binding domain-containing protein n=1 Tax=Dactylosporangium sp. McL0621 TaxID=3415678 RepID=UPI003CF81507